MQDEDFRQFREKIKDKQLELSTSLTNEELMIFIENQVLDYSESYPLTATQKIEIIKRIFNSIRGYDVLQPLLDDKLITEIMVNGPNDIFIEKNGEVYKAPVQFESQEKLEDIIQSIVSKVNRIVNEYSPIVDARLKDGSRVNVVLPPIALDGPTMTIRKFPEKPLLMSDLVEKNTLDTNVAEFLQALVQAKFNIFISGGTSSGKTTFLNVLTNFIPENERIITIEDSAELQIRSIPNIIRLETRNANSEGKGAITMRELIKASLRMRPSRIIIGEVRGQEAFDMLQAMNTGHDGSLSTGHANNSTDMLSRLETMVLSAANLPIEVIRKQLSSAIDILIHLARLRDNSRKIVEINEVLGVVDGEIKINPLYKFIEKSTSDKGKIIGELLSTGNHLINKEKLIHAGLQASVLDDRSKDNRV